jgi:hypothetical protein
MELGALINELSNNYLNYDVDIPKGRFMWSYVDKRLADALLERSNNVRDTSPVGVESYSREMCAGNWRSNGETIVIDDNGTLRNGHHRLTGVSKTGCPIWTAIVYDVSADQCDIYDVQLRRSLKQIQGGSATSCAMTIAARMVTGFRNKIISYGCAKEYYEKHFDRLEKIVTFSRLKTTGTPIGKKAGCQIMAYCMNIMGIQDDDIQDYFKVLNSGFNIDGRECSPAIVARNQIMQIKQRGYDLMTICMSVTYQSLKDFVAGKTRMKSYKVDDSWKQIYEAAKIKEEETT